MSLGPRVYQPNYNDTPQSVFKQGLTPKWNHCFKCIGTSKRCDRLVSVYDPHAILVYVDGCCINNGRADARGGAAFVHTYSRHNGSYSGHLLRLEDRGPTGELHEPTSNRAELRAVIAALRYRDWMSDNVRRLVIATDSEYVAKGCTDWVFKWYYNGWQTSYGRPVANQDLWRVILQLFGSWSDRGLQIEFWRVPRMADSMAKRGADEAQVAYWCLDF